MRIFDLIRRYRGFTIATVIVVVLILMTIGGLWVHWDWLRITDMDDGDSNAETLRNTVLVVAAVIALPLALWRSLVAERQVGTTQLGLLNERYQKGAEMLGSDVPAVRLGGIYALRSLAREYPHQYGIQILRLFCAFARHPTKDTVVGRKTLSEVGGNISEKVPKITIEARADIQTIMEAISAHDELGLTIETGILDLHGADLGGTFLRGANLSGVDFSDADLFGAFLVSANLSGARLYDANLSKAQLEGVEGLTQIQLDQARADPSYPPGWTSYTCDAETGAPLIWRDKLFENHG